MYKATALRLWCRYIVRKLFLIRSSGVFGDRSSVVEISLTVSSNSIGLVMILMILMGA